MIRTLLRNIRRLAGNIRYLWQNEIYWELLIMRDDIIRLHFGKPIKQYADMPEEAPERISDFWESNPSLGLSLPEPMTVRELLGGKNHVERCTVIGISCLNRAGIHTVPELCQKTAQEIIDLPGVGVDTLLHIVSCLASKGFSLRGSNEAR